MGVLNRSYRWHKQLFCFWIKQNHLDNPRRLGNQLQNHDEIELLAAVETSIVCFRYVPLALRFGRPEIPGRSSRRRPGETPEQRDRRIADEMLDEFNQELLTRLQQGGRVYLSNTRVNGRFALRACLVNFRTTRDDLQAVLDEVLTHGRRAPETVGQAPERPVTDLKRSPPDGGRHFGL